MNYLALDTSSLACTVALSAGHDVSHRHETRPREHTRLLMPMIRGLLDERGLAATDLDAIVLGNGPGSFIGLRIAASVAQGLAWGARIPVVPVSSMAAVALAVFDESGATDVVVAQDAHRDEVYLARYARGDDGLPRVVVEEHLHPIGTVERIVPDAECVAAGDAWHRYPALFEANAGRIGRIADARFPDARYLLRLGIRRHAEGGAVRAEDVAPAYLRDTVAMPPRATGP